MEAILNLLGILKERFEVERVQVEVNGHVCRVETWLRSSSELRRSAIFKWRNGEEAMGKKELGTAESLTALFKEPWSS